MKKFPVIFLVLMLALFFTACGTEHHCNPKEECCDGEGVDCPCNPELECCDGEGIDCPCDPETECCDGVGNCPDCDPETDCCEGEDCDDVDVVESTITKIQTGQISAGTEVTTECVVTGIYYAQDNETHENTAIKGLYVSDIIPKAKPNTGIYVFIKATAQVDEYAIGNKLEVTGAYKEYYENSQIEATEIKKLGSADLPEPAEIEDPASIATPFEDGNPTANHGVDSESYESVLVKVSNVKITNAALDTHGTFEVTGNLAIDKTFYYYPKNLRTEGREFESITGILIYSYNAFRLAPRDGSDFVEGEQPPETDNDEDVTDDDDVTNDEDVTDDTDVAEPSLATIKEIQGGEKEKKDLVRIENAVIISPVLSKDFNDGGTGYTFYVSDGTTGNYSGLYIYQVTGTAAPAKGDKVTIEGQVDFYGGQWEIKNAKNVGSIVKTGTGTVPAAIEKAYPALSDKDKGSLIEINELTVKSVEKPEGKNYTKITFEEKVGDKELIAENFGDVTFPDFQAGDALYVKGIYDVIFGSNGFYILNANDIEKRIY